MPDLSHLLAGLDKDNRRRGAQFELIVQWFLLNSPVYRDQLRNVWLWANWPGRWGIDAGIDLVAEHVDGRLWAIQAKAYHPTHSVTKADVDTFLSESSRSDFSFRLLVATTDRISPNAERTIEAQEKRCKLVGRAALDASGLDWPSNVGALLNTALPAKVPRSHQEAAINAVLDGFTRGDCGQLIMACGTGKTLTALFIAERSEAQRTLVLLPSLSLLAQTVREWKTNQSQSFTYLPVCSDETVSSPDAVVSSASDLGFPVTTDAAEIAAFLRRQDKRLVVFGTYQSSPSIAEAFKIVAIPHFDLVIADEAHRCAGRVTSDFATVLDRQAIPAKRRLFMTATPRFFTGRVLREAKAADYEVASMDDESRFGPVFHRLSFREAIERELLSDYQVSIMGIDNSAYREWVERGQLLALDGIAVTDARTLASQVGLAKAMSRYGLSRTISFHSRVATARSFARSMPDILNWMPSDQRPDGVLWADYVSGDMSAGDRATKLQHLRDLSGASFGLLTNARCLSEGLDVPTLDGVAFIDPRRSEVDIVQAVGRAIRKSPGKILGTIIIPVYISSTDDPATALGDSTFQPVWDILKALRAHDADLGAELDALRRELGRSGTSGSLPAKVHLDLPAWVSRDFASAIEVRLVERTTSTWESWFGMLVEHVEATGHAHITQFRESLKERWPLGTWVSRQRVVYANGEMSSDRITRLEALSGWSWSPGADQWEDGFLRLQVYAREIGTALMPVSLRDATGFRVGQWAATQRSQQKTGGLSVEQVDRLASLPGWTEDLHEMAWTNAYQRLVVFAAVEGHPRPASDYTDLTGFRLGAWVAEQRTAYRRRKQTHERTSQLEALPGWTWTKVADQWETGFKLLMVYSHREGAARPPAGFVEDGGFRLGKWVGRQRDFHDAGRISEERAVRLAALPGWTWDGLVHQWETGYEHLATFVREQGHSRVTKRHVAPDGYRLGQWIEVQRRAKRGGTLSLERVARLDAQPGWDKDLQG